MKRVTIKDLASILNLSKSTISRALSDHPDISEATKERVRLAAAEFNYSTNVHAAHFRNKRSGLIALVLPEFNMFFTPGLVDGINKVIAGSKNSLIVFLSNDSFKTEKKIIQQCLNWAVEGVLISLSKGTTTLDHLAPLQMSGITCIMLDKTLENEVFPTVTIDNIAASYQAVSYLIEKGHRNILGIFGSPNYRISQERIKGYVKAMKDHKVPLLPENIISVDKSADLDFILPAVLRHNEEISAIFTMSDELLAKCYSHVMSIGLHIPDDLAIISISDGIYPYLTFPKITHIKNSGKDMGKKACKLLIGKINKRNANSEDHLIVGAELVELDSV